MDRDLQIGTYSPEAGVHLEWAPGFWLEVVVSQRGEVLIRGNRSGLVSLAQHALTLAQEHVPAGVHVHLSAYDALEPESPDLVIERVDSDGGADA